MKKSRLWIAIVVLAGLSVAAVMTTRSHQAESKVEKPTASVPTVNKDEVSALEIAKPGQPAIVLQKQADKSWKLTAPVDAPADKDAVESALDKLSKLEVLGIAATRKENHARLEVDAEHAIRVKAKAGDKPLADLYVGAAKSGGTMLRVEGQDQVLTADGSFRYLFDKEAKDLRNHQITDFDGLTLTNIAITSPKGNYKFERAENTWAQAKGEKPIARFDPEKVHSLAGTLSHLYATDFAAPGEGDDVTGLAAPVAKITLTKKEGDPVVIAVGKTVEGGDAYVRANGRDVVYRVSKFTADGLSPDDKAFQKAEVKPGEAAPAAALPRMPGMPEGPMPELPPEVMEQLRKSMAKSGQLPPGH